MCASCRSQKTLQNEYFVAKIGVDTAENGPSKVHALVSGARLRDLRRRGPISARARSRQARRTRSVRASHASSQVSPLRSSLETVRSQLYRRRFLQPNTHFAAFFEIYKMRTFCTARNSKNLQNFIKMFLKCSYFS